MTTRLLAHHARNKKCLEPGKIKRILLNQTQTSRKITGRKTNPPGEIGRKAQIPIKANGLQEIGKGSH